MPPPEATPTGHCAPELSRTIQALGSWSRRGWDFGTQLYVSLPGKVLADLAVGVRAPDSTVPLSPDDLLPWTCAGKPPGAVAFGQLMGAGLVDIDDCVAQLLPDFARGGKAAITFRHLLSHTTGLAPDPALLWDVPREAVLEAIAVTPHPDPTTIGHRASYSTWWAWWVLAAAIEELTGELYRTYLRDHVFVPAGMADTHCGLTSELTGGYRDRVVDSYFGSGLLSGPRNAFGLAFGARHGSWDCMPMYPFHRASVPGSSVAGPAHDLGRFYEALLEPASLGLTTDLQRMITTRQRSGMFEDPPIIDAGLGVVLESSHYGPKYTYFGRRDSLNSFGHDGLANAFGLCDPDVGLVIAVVGNHSPTQLKKRLAWVPLVDAIYDDLEVAGLVRVSASDPAVIEDARRRARAYRRYGSRVKPPDQGGTEPAP